MLIVAYIFLFAGACVVLINWGCVIANLRLQRRGVHRHISGVPFVAQIFALAAAIASYNAPRSTLPSVLFWLVALADVPILSILYLPLFLLRRRMAGRR